MRSTSTTLGAAIILAASAMPALAELFSDAVTVFRSNDGLICKGWQASGGVVITAAHCVTKPGHFWISHEQKDYHAYRIRIHPQFSPELLLFPPDEVNPDLASIVIAQRNLSVAPRDIMLSRDIRADMRFFIMRNGERIEIEVSGVELRKNGLRLSNGSRNLSVCPGDSGAPLYVESKDRVFIAGIVTANQLPPYEVRSDSFCGIRLEIVDMDTVLEFYPALKTK
jgi:hypothetical protein